MKKTHWFLAAAVLAAAGCTHPASPPASEAPTETYVLLSAGQASVAIAGVTASSSSTRDPRWFATDHLIDGNTHSAWGPAASDAQPTLTLDLGAEIPLSGLAIKLTEAPITFDVEAWRDGAWVAIATDVAPTYGALDFLPLPTTVTRRLRLVFDRTEEARLLVCEIEAFRPDPPAAPCCVATIAGSGGLGLPGSPQAPGSAGLLLSFATGSEGFSFSFVAGSASYFGVAETIRCDGALAVGEAFRVAGPITGSSDPGTSPGTFEAELVVTSRTDTTFTAAPRSLTYAFEGSPPTSETVPAIDPSTSTISGTIGCD